MTKYFCKGSIWLLLITFHFSAYATIEGEIKTEGGTYEYKTNLGDVEFPSNTIGATVHKTFSLGGKYTQIVYCSSRITGDTFYKATTNLNPGADGFAALNEYIDVQVKYFVAENGNVAVPFTEVDNHWSFTCSPPSSKDDKSQSGNSGEVTFRLRKPIINGLNIHSSGLSELFGRVGTVASNAFGNEAIARLTLTSTIFTVTDKCTINNGNPINIEFGTVPNTSKQLNGANYQQDMSVPIECTGGGFDGNSSVQFAIQPASGVSAFNSDYLATSGTVDRSNLGIVIKNRAGNTISPNQFYKVPSVSNTSGYKGTWNLVAAPVANQGATIPEGDFEASATIVARFQ